jgi:hypothetical protein
VGQAVRTREIDPLKAIRLSEEGRSWREIGVILAAEIKRRTPFQSLSVSRAVRAHDRREVKP